MTFKSFTANEYSITPFVTHKNQSYTIVSGSSTNPQEISFDVAVAPPSQNWSFFPNLEIQNADGIYQRTLYNSILNEFYSSASTLPYSISQSVASMNFGAGGSHFRNYIPSSSIYVLNIAQSAFGEGIRPGSFSLTDLSSSFNIMDDGMGRLVISSSNTASVVGNIFYNLGVCVINPSITSYLTPDTFALVQNANYETHIGGAWGPLFLTTHLTGSEYSGYTSAPFISGTNPPNSNPQFNVIPIITSSAVPSIATLIFNANAQSSGSASAGLNIVVNTSQVLLGSQIIPITGVSIATGSWNHYEIPITASALSFLTGSHGGFGVDKNFFSIQVNPNFTASVSMSSAAIRMQLPGGIYLQNPLNISFDATQTIYTHQAICSFEPTEFTFSSNPSCFVTNSLGQKIPDLFLSGNLLPYVTTVGLYDSDYELIAVAKVPNPIKRLTETEQSFIIRLDA